ncbi:MAG: alanine--tRNA ligase [Anaerolineaceae bacterium]|nr:MAG: alanine--tRNA ligase [Anaerolineaceae bacterium]
MHTYGVNELRKMFLDFFESKDHLVLKSFPLIPRNDNSLLLINAGMAPLKPYFTGQEEPPSKRVATCQKCIRTNDIENVGKTSRHATFFEMLGNFSFGDYFKSESLAWSWEFLTEVIGLDKNRLYPSVYLEDDEAFDIWNKEIGIAKERIYRMGKEDNFWEIGSGPCGPCSEIYYDRGEKYGCGEDTCEVGCECDRFIEVWNNVFTQFYGDGQGNYTELEKKNIDTGMGLERLAVAVQDVESIFDIDTFKVIREKVCELAGVEYLKSPKNDESIRIITDHIRAVTFMASDGIIPSNEGRGYIFRRLLRRAARHGRLLGIKNLFLAELSGIVIKESKDGYPELEEKKDYILKLLAIEEEKFNKTIDQGLSILSDMQNDLEKNNQKILPGEDVFKLYDTYGFPFDLTKEILEEKGYELDEKGFLDAMEVQRETARSARGTTNYMGSEETIYQQLDHNLTTKFVGYETLNHSSDITALTTETDIVNELLTGQRGTVIVEETPFYATSGGQSADIGVIIDDAGEFVVEDTIHLQGGKIGHVGLVTKGSIKVNDKVNLKVNPEHRASTAKNHSATHLLQKALRMVLGNHVEQAGSFVSNDRLRFDFTHFSAMTDEEISRVEEIVNEHIAMSLPVNTQLMSIDEAKKEGAMALFGEKYSEEVRVVSMGEFSKELCGGTHVTNTGTITVFKILSDTGIAAGVRRIEALTGQSVLDHYKELENKLFDVAKAAKAEPSQLIGRIESLFDEIKTLKSENEKLKSKLASDSLGDVMNQVKEVAGVKLLAANVPELDMNGLRNLGDKLKDKLGEGVVILASSTAPDKVSIVAMVSDEAIKKGAHAGNLIKELALLVGGGGGGRPNMAQAGGKNAAGIPDVIAKAVQALENQLK